MKDEQVKHSEPKKIVCKRTPAIFWVMIILSIVSSATAICMVFVNRDVFIENASIILVFVGVLATFVVVSNYAQVKAVAEHVERLEGEVNALVRSTARKAIAGAQEAANKAQEATNKAQEAVDIAKKRAKIVSALTERGDAVNRAAWMMLKASREGGLTDQDISELENLLFPPK